MITLSKIIEASENLSWNKYTLPNNASAAPLVALPVCGAVYDKLATAYSRSCSINAYTSDFGDLGIDFSSPKTKRPSGLIGISPNHFTNSKL